MQKRRVKVYNKSENALPTYATKLSAGFDIRADLSRICKVEDLVGNSEYFTLTIPEKGTKIVTVFPSGGRVLIPTGLHVAIPDGYELEVRPRSGLALKNGITLTNAIGTIDSDFRGEIGLIILNTDPKKSFEIQHGDRLAQGILKKVNRIEWEQVYSIEELGNTTRGEGGFGHTGKN
jgi:dUTP pyrophosphatase